MLFLFFFQSLQSDYCILPQSSCNRFRSNSFLILNSQPTLYNLTHWLRHNKNAKLMRFSLYSMRKMLFTCSSQTVLFYRTMNHTRSRNFSAEDTFHIIPIYRMTFVYRVLLYIKYNSTWRQSYYVQSQIWCKNRSATVIYLVTTAI